ncbi:hypothetical protein [Bradyrhizobium sp.]|uniref:hypothetical protein n=1 Tax=Bradyrhizobium sp. TaxID=376 RepID=UPI0039E25466
MDDTTNTSTTEADGDRPKQNPSTPEGQDAGAPVIGGVPDAKGPIQPENSEGKMDGTPTGTAESIAHPAETWLQKLEDKLQHIAEELREEFAELIAKARAAL